MLNGYAAIQYHAGLQFAGSWYTEDLTLFFLNSGALSLYYGKELYHIRAGQMVLVNKNILVEFRFSCESSDEPLEYFQFSIRNELVNEFTKMTAVPKMTSEKHKPVIVKNGDVAWQSYVHSLNTYISEPNEPAQGLVRIKMLEFLYRLLCIDSTIFNHLLEIREDHIDSIMSTVEQNISNSLSVGQLARLAGRSVSSFRREFVSIYNMPPSHWIRLKRLEKAKELLLGSTMSITDICYTLGFEHIAHFSKLFKSHFGCSPSAYKFG